MMGTNRGELRWECYCKLQSFCLHGAHTLPSYPLAYSLVVLPLTIARWSLFDHEKVSSAATFFSVSVFNLSGAINVILFLIVRPQLLLFTPPEELSEPEEVAELGQPATGSAIFTDSAKYTHSPQVTRTGLAGDGESDHPLDGNNIVLSRIESKPRPDDI
jgi:hypothetical protein